MYPGSMLSGLSKIWKLLLLNHKFLNELGECEVEKKILYFLT